MKVVEEDLFYLVKRKYKSNIDWKKQIELIERYQQSNDEMALLELYNEYESLIEIVADYVVGDNARTEKDDLMSIGKIKFIELLKETSISDMHQSIFSYLIINKIYLQMICEEISCFKFNNVKTHKLYKLIKSTEEEVAISGVIDEKKVLEQLKRYFSNCGYVNVHSDDYSILCALYYYLLGDEKYDDDNKYLDYSLNDELFRNDRADKIKQIFDELKPKEREALIKYYGFLGNERNTLCQIAQESGCSSEWVRQCIKKGIYKIRKNIYKKKPFDDEDF